MRPRRWVAAAVALCAGAGAAAASAGETLPASRIEMENPAPSPQRSYTTGWVAIASGVALDAASFVLADRADDAYARYQAGTDPAQLTSDYDTAVHNDRWASATLIAGQACLAFGLYELLLRHPSPAKSHASAPGSPAGAARSWRLQADPLASRIGVCLRF